MSEKEKRRYDVEAKWTMKTVALALLQGNAAGYAENPTVWIADAHALTQKLLIATDLFARKDIDGTQNT